MGTSIVHLFISSRGFVKVDTRQADMRVCVCVWAKCDCGESCENASEDLHRISSQPSWPVHVSDSQCVCVWMEDDPPTLSHIGSGTLAVRRAHLVNTGLTHSLRGRIRVKRVTTHTSHTRTGLCVCGFNWRCITEQGEGFKNISG